MGLEYYLCGIGGKSFTDLKQSRWTSTSIIDQFLDPSRV